MSSAWRLGPVFRKTATAYTAYCAGLAFRERRRNRSREELADRRMLQDELNRMAHCYSILNKRDAQPSNGILSAGRIQGPRKVARLIAKKVVNYFRGRDPMISDEEIIESYKKTVSERVGVTPDIQKQPSQSISKYTWNFQEGKGSGNLEKRDAQLADTMVDLIEFSNASPHQLMVTLNVLQHGRNVGEVAEQLIASQVMDGTRYSKPMELSFRYLLDRYPVDQVIDVVTNMLLTRSPVSWSNVLRIYYALGIVVNWCVNKIWRTVNVSTFGWLGFFDRLSYWAPTFEFIWRGIYSSSDWVQEPFNSRSTVTNEILLRLGRIFISGKFASVLSWFDNPWTILYAPEIVQAETDTNTRVSVETQTDISGAEGPVGYQVGPSLLYQDGEYEIQIEEIEQEEDPRLAEFNRLAEAAPGFSISEFVSPVAPIEETVQEEEPIDQLKLDLLNDAYSRFYDHPRYNEYYDDVMNGETEVSMEDWLDV